MPLTKLQFQPGINRETTSYSNEGGWFDMDKVRFRAGFPEKIGGWQKLGPKSFLGTCRALHDWRTLALDNYIGVGTSSKYYIEFGQGYYDITPIRDSLGLGQDVTVNVAGVEGTGEVGEAEGIGYIYGVEATGAVGFVVVTGDNAGITVSPTGVAATGSVGDVDTVTSVVVGTDSIDFAATDGSSTITITCLNHGAVEGDFVTFSGAIDLGGNITESILNQEYKIETIVDGNTFTILAREVASVADITVDGVYTPNLVTANASDTGSGGDDTQAAFQINVGLDTAVFGNGWGAGTWSRGGWGTAATVDILSDTLRIWSHDNFGEDLIINVSDGGIYYWDADAGSALTTRAVPLTDLAGASNPPTVATKVLVSNNDRHVIAFGCNPLGSSTQDPLLIRFSDQENAADWTPRTTNTAGDLIVGSGSKIVTAVETRQQILVFTEKSLHVMQYLGAPFTFGINTISENVTISAPNAPVAVEDQVFWMGENEFYVYSGAVQKLPCTVKDYVFSDFNTRQQEKVFAATNTAFSEIWWFYPSADSDNIDRYVVYNYQQQVWYYGSMARTAWIDRGLNQTPIAASTDNYLYNHEDGFDDGSTNPASAMTAYIESSQIDIGDGNNFSFVSRVIPDLTFRNSTNETPSATFTLKARNFPGGNYLQDDDETVSKISSSPVEQFTNQIYVRLRGRSIALRVESDTTGVGWRLGTPRMDVRQDGRR